MNFYYIEILFYIIFFVSVFSFLSIAPWVPTFKKDLARVNSIVNIKKWENFLEMWCWTATVSLFIAKNNPSSSVTAIELSPLLYLISKLRVYFSGLDNIEVIYWNALKLDLTKFDVIYVFWLPETVTKKIFPNLVKQISPSFRFISYCFQMKNDYFKETKHKEEKRYAIYEYKL